LIVKKKLEFGTGAQFSETLATSISAPAPENLRNIMTPVLIYIGKSNQPKGFAKYNWLDDYLQFLPNALLKLSDVAGHDPWLV
jgi:hypothetical protein